MLRLLAAVAVLALLSAGAFALAPTKYLETRISIDAPPETVWSVLTDGEAYSEWNPFIVAMKGEIAVGATLENSMRPSADSEIIFRPRVLAVEPGSEFRWLGRLILPRIFDGEHYFLMERENGGTRLVHGERFTGIALWFIDAERFRPNFEAMNVALKRRAEGMGN